MRLGATGALALAAASTGVLVPVLRLLVEQSGHGSTAAGVFTAAHVIGGAAGAAVGVRALRAAGSARTLAVTALVASIAVTLAMAALDSLAARVGLRFLDGACHLLAITSLIAAATAGDAELRIRRAVANGLAIVLGIAGGLGIGAVLGHATTALELARLGYPEAALIVAALLSAAALVVVLAQVAAEPLPVARVAEVATPAPLRRSRARGPIAPGLLAFGERSIFGIMTVATPFLASPSRVGLVIGVFMTSSVCTLYFARRYALTWGPRRLAVRSSLALVLGLGFAAAVDVLASLGIALLWALACGAAAGSLYASALVLATRSSALEDRMRDMATVNAAGSAGHAFGALCAGVLLSTLPGTLVIALPGAAIIAAAALGMWLTVPEPATDAPGAGAHEPAAASQ